MSQLLPGRFRSADAHTAFSKAQIQHLVHLPALFHQGVLADHADVRRTVLHISGDVRTLGQEEFETQLLIYEDQLPAVRCLLYTSDAADDV